MSRRGGTGDDVLKALALGGQLWHPGHGGRRTAFLVAPDGQKSRLVRMTTIRFLLDDGSIVVAPTSTSRDYDYTITGYGRALIRRGMLLTRAYAETRAGRQAKEARRG